MTKTVWEKLLAAVLVCTLLVGCAAGAGGSTTTGDSTTTTVTDTTTTVPTTTASPTTTKTTTTTTKKVTTTTQPPAARAGDLMEGVTASDVRGKEPNDAFVKAQMDWSLKLFQKSVMTSKNENVLISPLSVQLALAMTANGASGQTRQEMETVLGRGLGLSELNGYLKQHTARLQAVEGQPLKLANSIWLRDTQDFTVKPSFLQTNADYYGASIYRSVFDESTRKRINTWVSKNTNGKINSLLDRVEEDDVMYLINAVLFEGSWQTPYGKESIENQLFTTVNGEKRTVKMMMDEYRGGYLDDGSAKGFKLSYAEGGKYYADRFSFVALVPNEGVELYEYIAGLTGESLWNTVSEYGGEADRVITGLPKFKYDYELNMNTVLQQMGMSAAFNWETADFSGIGSHAGGEKLYIGGVLHKTAIDLDEKGTQAAAATIVTMGAGASMYDPPIVKTVEIKLDRPFMYMIVDNKHNLPVFIGAVTDIGN